MPMQALRTTLLTDQPGVEGVSASEGRAEAGSENQNARVSQEMYRAWHSSERPKFSHYLHELGWEMVCASLSLSLSQGLQLRGASWQPLSRVPAHWVLRLLNNQGFSQGKPTRLCTPPPPPGGRDGATFGTGKLGLDVWAARKGVQTVECAEGLTCRHPVPWQAQENVMYYAEIFGGGELVRKAQELIHKPGEPLTASPAPARPYHPPPPRLFPAAAAQPPPSTYPQPPNQDGCKWVAAAAKAGAAGGATSRVAPAGAAGAALPAEVCPAKGVVQPCAG